MLLATLADVWPPTVTFHNRLKVAIAPWKVNCSTDDYLRQIGTVVLSEEWCELSDKIMPLCNVNYVAAWQLLSSHPDLNATWIRLVVAFYIWIQIVNTSKSKTNRIPSICKAQQVQELHKPLDQDLWQQRSNYWGQLQDMRCMTMKQSYKRIIHVN